MNPEEAFLTEIQAKPSDKFLRSAFADWLDEQGDSRGEILRKIEAGMIYEAVGQPTLETFIELELSFEQSVLYACDVAEHVLTRYYTLSGKAELANAIAIARSFDLQRIKQEEENIEPVGKAFVGPMCSHYDSHPKEFVDRLFAIYGMIGFQLEEIVSCKEAPNLWTNNDTCESTFMQAESAVEGSTYPDQQWKWNLKRLAEYKYFKAIKLWTL